MGMKVAVSIPDPVFADAEALAKRLRTTRSDIYARALHAFVGAHAPDRVTQAMNETLDAIDDDANDFGRFAAVRILKNVEW